jgi:protease-4
LILRLHGLRVGWARLDELREAVLAIREAGKPVVVYFSSGPSDGGYYLASAADWIVAPPISLVGLDGLRSEATFYKGTMDKLGIEFDFERIGDYKSAPEQYSRTSMSEPARENREAILDDIFNELTRKIAAGRDMTVDRVMEVIDNGPYNAIEAREAGLVDQIAYQDELPGIAGEMIGHQARRVSLGKLAKRKEHRYAWGPEPKVAIIFAEGTILSGSDRKDLWAGEVMGSNTIAAAIRQARGDRDVKAIVLRINSSGGSGIASDIILREIRRTVGVKPLVVSMSDMAASGGYYIGCTADSVFALPATITGSIGVYFGKVSLAGLYEKIGITREVLTRGKHADIYSLDRPLNEDEREILRRQLRMFYENFLAVVAEGRHRTRAEIDSIGRGRVWTGRDARAIGLIDEYGGLLRAVSAAAQLAGIDDEKYEILPLPRPHWGLPFSFTTNWLGLHRGVDDLLSGTSELSESSIWYLMPWRWKIE